MILALLNLIFFLLIVSFTAHFFLTGYEFQRLSEGKYFSPDDRKKVKDLANHKFNKYSVINIVVFSVTGLVSIWWLFNGNIWNGLSLWILLFAKWYELDWAKKVRNLKNK